MENKEINIAHFSFKDNYGAMAAAYELHKALARKGVKSSFFVREKTRDDDSIIEVGYEGAVEERLNRVINKLYFQENRKNSGIASINFDCLGIQWNKQLEDRLKEYDILHIHWVAGFLSMDNIYQLSRLGKPIVWTMHDFHAFTGGCHCPEMCKKYEDDCSECPELNTNYSNITKNILLEKQRKYSKNIQIVTASTWLKEIVHCSKVFRHNPCEVIPIGINTEFFIPINKAEMKQKIGLSADTKVILIGAQALYQNVKGYVHLKSVLEIIKKDAYCSGLIRKKKLVLLTFGNVDKTEDYGGGISIVNMGFIGKREHLCEIYNAADVFVFPSVQDTFGMTAVESMSCGVPTVAFDVSAMRDIIISGVNGYKAELNDYSAMASDIIHILKENPIKAEVCRERIIDNYSLECEVGKMLQLYHRMTEQSSVTVYNGKEHQKSEELQRFIYKCSYEILIGNAPKCYGNMSAQGIFLEYHSWFMTPEQKVRKLLRKQIIDYNESIYIYGAGEYGKRTLRELKKHGISIKKFWDVDERKEGQLIGGYYVQKPEKKNSNKKKIIIAGINYEEMVKFLMELGYLYCQDFY